MTVDTLSLPPEIQENISYGIAHKQLQVFSSREGVIGCIVKSEFADLYIDGKFIFRHPLFPSTRIETYCLVGDKQKVKKFIVSEVRGQAYLSLIEQYGEDEVRSWDRSRTDGQMETATHETYLKYMLA